MPASPLDNQLRKRIRMLIRNNIENDDYEEVVLDDMLRIHYGALSQREIAVCKCILNIASGGLGAWYIEVINRLERVLFPSAHDIATVIRELISRGVIEWMALLRPMESDPTTLRKWECLNLRPKRVKSRIYAALNYADVMRYEMMSIDDLGLNYFQDMDYWLNILNPPRKSNDSMEV